MRLEQCDNHIKFILTTLSVYFVLCPAQMERFHRLNLQSKMDLAESLERNLHPQANQAM